MTKFKKQYKVTMMKSMQPMMSRHNNSEQQSTLDRTPVNARPSITQRSTERYTNHTTGFARRALLLLMFFVASVGSAWGQTFNTKGKMVEGGKEEHIYLDILNLSEAEIAINQIDVINALNSLGSNWTSENIADNIYIRWSLFDGNGDFANNVSNDQWNYQNGEIYFASIDYNLQTRKDIAGFYYFKQAYSYADFSQVLRAKVQVDRYNMFNKTLEDFKDNTVVCYITDDLSGIETTSNWPYYEFKQESNFKIKYVFHFGAKVDDFTNGPNPAGCTTGAKSKEIETEEPQTINLNDAFAKTPDINYKYVRIYLENNGKVVDPDGKLNVSYNGTSITLDADFKERGYYHYKEDGTLQASDFNMTLGVPEGEFENYQVVCVFAKDIDSSWPDREPYWDLQFTYSFEYPFKGQVTDETVKMETTFEIPVSKKSSNFTFAIDYNSSSVSLSSNYTNIATAPIDEKFLNAFPDNTITNDYFYIRWFLRNNGEEIYIPKSLADAWNGIYQDPVKDRYYYWEKGKTYHTNLSDILPITLNASVLSELTDYELVFTIATNSEGKQYENGNLTHEPNTMAYEYTFHFIDQPFETKTIENIKSKIAVYNPVTGEVSPDLFTDYTATMTDLGTDASNFCSNGYLRWYVIDTKGNMIDITSDATEWKFDAQLTYESNDYGYYIEPVTYLTEGDEYNKTAKTEDIPKLNPTFTLPSNIRENYKQYQIVCVITKDKSKGSLPDYEPTTMQVKYVFDLWTEQELNDIEKRPFIHYQGEAYRYLTEELGDFNGAKQRDYIIVDGEAPENNYTWNISTNTYVKTTENIRQGVHTWEYYLYVIPGADPRKLILPFQNYTGGGQDQDPQAYIRWYNWNTDKKVESDGTFTFNKVGTFLTEIDDRGLFNIYQGYDQDLCHNNVGVTFEAKEGFSSSIDIACDVSKYSDGMIELGDKYYLLREPTLSNRYIFHIRPASEMADRLDAMKQKMEAAEKMGDAETLFDVMSELEEDKGKVIVSLGKNTDGEIIGNFSLRFDQPDYADYILKKESGYTPAVSYGVQWYVYYENNGTIKKEPIIVSSSAQNDRIFIFDYSKFENIGNGKKHHVVGFVGDGSGTVVPVVHYELHFIEAPPISIDDLIDYPEKHKERTYAYMNYFYDRAGVVDFDGNLETNPNVAGHEAEYYSTSNWYDAPTSSANNMTYVPFAWDDIQYGFCHPELAPTIKNGYYLGVSPDHGEYIILKSMNVPGISSSDDTTPYRFHWWDDIELRDYTYNLTKNTDSPQHGSFLYVDASDEARCIATIPFNASLCNGSSIYFTAFIADKTDQRNNIYPELLIRIVGIKDDGTRHRIMAFHTCDIRSAVVPANMDDETAKELYDGKWFQIYSESTMPADFDPTITHFEAEIINYARGTSGADFAIDQIVLYTSNTKVLLTQTSKGDCKEEEENTVKIYMEAEGLQSAFNIDEEKPQAIYWRVCEEGTNNVVKAPGMYPRYSCTYNEETGEYMISEEPEEDDGTNEYGIVYVYVKSNYSKDDEKQETDLYGWFYDEEEAKYYFQIADKTFEWLERGKNYYVSVYSPQGDIEENNASDWGNPVDICSIYSEFFIPRRQYVTFIVPESDGEEGGEITIACGSTEGAKVSDVVMVLKVPDENEITGFRDEKISFDYIINCSKSEWNKSANLGNGITYGQLIAALTDYRQSYPKKIGLHDDYQHETYRKILEDAIEAKLLILAASSEFTYTFNEAGTHYVTCIPISDKVSKNDETTICGPFEVIFKLKSSGGPSLALGFDDVTTYPNGYRVVRVGLGQLDNMQKNSYRLHIPVNMFKTEDKATVNEGKLTIISDFLQLLTYSSEPTAVSQTNDRTVTNEDESSAINVATFDDKEISASRKYISINFNGTAVVKQAFHEGFTYHMFFQVKKEGATASDCEGNVNFLLKVVPEYVTWNDAGTTITPNNNVNTNWNNDGNWSRSKKEELYSDTYVNNIGETPAAFVPMKFTYVTIPSNNVAPILEGLTIGQEGIYNNIGTGATTNIQYDLMVRMEEKCLDDKHSENGTSNIYDCEKFYGNWAKEIYFKPEAELVNQYYLTYEKVWVEKELTAGTWYLMSTPLQNTYAGDMYVPTTGRQETEAFKDIEFNTTDYSRTLYPIYQKSWLQEGSKVYTTTNDIRQTDYSANLVGSVSETLSLWSHTYNDVQVNYSQWKGFAIRAHKTDYNGTRNNALLRLPKEDTDYDYYKWDSTIPTDGMDAQTVDKKAKDGTHLATGKLFTDGTPNTYGLTYGVDYIEKGTRTAGNGEISVPIGEVQDAKTYPNNIANYYLLIGNPYLCSIDMEKFLKKNEGILENSYWTYEYNTYKKGSIKPLQAFFVKLKEEITDGDKTITFTPDMMMDGNTAPITPAARTMMMTATNDRGQSTATVSVGEKAQSIETLFDSNLADVPMVYTVANGQAVSVNQMTELDRPIAFGVTCSSNEPVSVTFSDVAQLTSGEVWVVDAVTGEQTTVTEGSAVSVQPNDYGRYFLLAGALNIGDKTDVQQGIMVSVRDRMVAVTSGEELTSVHVMSPDGTTVRQHTGGGTTASFVLSPGVYVIKAENIACEQQTVKVIVK